MPVFTDDFVTDIDPAWDVTDSQNVISVANSRVYFERTGAADVWGDPGLVYGPLTRDDVGGFSALLTLTNFIDNAKGFRVALSPSSTDSGAAGAGAITHAYPELWAEHRINRERQRSIRYMYTVVKREGGGWIMLVSAADDTGEWAGYPNASIIGVVNAGSDATIYAHLAARVGRVQVDRATVLTPGERPTGFDTRYGAALLADTFNRASLGVGAEFGGQAYTLVGTPSIASNALSAGTQWHGVIADPGEAPRVFKATVNTGASNNGVRILLRSDGTTSSGLRYHADTTLSGIYRLDNGSPVVQTGAYHLDNNSTHEITLYDYGDHITVELDGDEQIVDTTLFNTQRHVGVLLDTGTTCDEVSFWPESVSLTGSGVGLFPAPPSIDLGALLSADDFTDPDGTALPTHDPSWTVRSGTWEINGNKARMTTADVSGVITRDAGGTDHVSRAIITLPAVQPPEYSINSEDWYPAVFVRWSDSNNYIQARYLEQMVSTTSNPEVEVRENNGGVDDLFYVQLGPDVLPPDTDHELILAVYGTMLAAYHDGELVVEAVTSVVTGTQAGIGVLDNNPVEQPRWDDVAIYTVSDVPPPAFTNIDSQVISPTSFRALWTTDRVADSQVEYGYDTNYGNATPLDPTPRTSHEVVVGGLIAGSTVHWRPRSSG